MRACFVLFAALLVGCAQGAGTIGGPRQQVLRDAEGYVVASCLSFQSQPYLKDQGDAWSSAIVQRMKGNLDVLASLANQVKREIAKGDMAVIRQETGNGIDKALPILYCSEMIDRPSVRAAIQDAVLQLEPSYRK